MARVLYLEDEEILVEDVPILLQEQGLKVKSTASIEEALEWFAAEDFDVVLLDIMMTPSDDMDDEQVDYGRETGVEVARKMKAVKPGVPIVAFTILRDPEIHARMRDAGVAEIVNKPCEPVQVSDAIWRLIRK
jgi:CheY-like chemotaxis protein